MGSQTTSYHVLIDQNGESTSDTTVTQQIEAAVAVLDDERECLEVERAAFAQFRKRIAAIDVSTLDSPTATARVKNAVVGPFTAPTSRTQIEQIRDAYCETVMNVPHYEDDYGQSLDDHLATEFSPELVNGLTTSDSLTPQLHEALLSGSQQASESRDALLSALNREIESIQQVRDALGEMNTALDEMNQQPLATWSTNEIISGYERLQEFETQCDELAADRQTELHSQRVRGPKHAGEEFNEYLYKPLSVTYPVLADIAGFNSLLRTARQHLERALTNR